MNLAIMATELGLDVEWFEPDAADGPGQTYSRDFRLIDGADNVIAYFDVNDPMEGGTGHVVDAAMGKGVQVTAYTLDEHGKLELLGEFDPE